MALSDCIKCWNTPCDCGYDYGHMSKSARIDFAAVVLGITKEELASLVSHRIPHDHPMKERVRIDDELAESIRRGRIK